MYDMGREHWLRLQALTTSCRGHDRYDETDTLSDCPPEMER